LPDLEDDEAVDFLMIWMMTKGKHSENALNQFRPSQS